MQDMRARAHRKRPKVPAVNRSALAAGAALLQLEGGVESKRSGRGRAREQTTKEKKNMKKPGGVFAHSSQVQPSGLRSVRKPVAGGRKRQAGSRKWRRCSSIHPERSQGHTHARLASGFTAQQVSHRGVGAAGGGGGRSGAEGRRGGAGGGATAPVALRRRRG